MKRIASFCMSFLMLLLLIPAVPASAVDFSEEGIRSAMLALQSQYPEGTPYTNSNFWDFKGGLINRGYGCAGFAFMLSDAAFGSLPARYYYDYSKIRVGDILRMNNNSHSVIVLYVNADSVTVAEGNYNSKVHWGRVIPMSEVRNGSTTYGMTRYPESIPSALTKGDVTGDGKVSAEDAQIVLQAYVRKISGYAVGLTQVQLAGADVDGNGVADVADAQHILRYYAANVLAGRNYSWDYILSRH